MSMLEDFFGRSRNSKDHFDGLEISKETALCEQWMNQCLVVFLTLKDDKGLTFNDAYGMLRVLISELCIKYAYLFKACLEMATCGCSVRGIPRALPKLLPSGIASQAGEIIPEELTFARAKGLYISAI